MSTSEKTEDRESRNEDLKISEPESVSTDCARKDPLIGKTVCDRYQVERLVGQSAVAAVYQARMFDGKTVVLKVPLSTNHLITTVFATQVEKAIRLEHPNIVRSFAIERNRDTRPFQVMEFVPAVTLAELLESQDFVELEDEIFELLNQIASALKYAHDKGILHGRLMPSNIMILENDGVLSIKLLDFGIDEVYRFIEQNLGQPARQLCNKKTDVYQLGLLAHYICTGKTPIPGKTIEEAMLSSSSNEKPQLLSFERTDLYCVDELSQLLEEATDPEDEWRLDSVQQFQERLEQWMAHVAQARTRTSELAEQIAESTASDTTVAPVQRKPGTVSREIKTTIRTIVRLRKNESSQAETLLMQFTDKVARAGPRRSPLETAARLVGIVLLSLTLIGSVLYAFTNHNETMKRIWLNASHGLSSIVFKEQSEPAGNSEEGLEQLEREKVAFANASDDKKPSPVASTIPQGMSEPVRPNPPQLTPAQIYEFYKGSAPGGGNNKQKRHFRVEYREFNQDWLK